MNDRLVKAFRESSRGYSTDRVICDPDLNRRFIKACIKAGLKEPPVDLNLRLLNLRKRAGLRSSDRRTSIRNQDDYLFAAEMAGRCLERKHQTTLDRVLCDPALAAEFDETASRIAPGYTPLQYRWAALRLRKTNRLKPELLGRIIVTQVIGPLSISNLKLSQIPNEPGLYLLTTRDRVLYIGEAQNLRVRSKKHLDHSDNEFLARHIWDCGMADLMLECHVLPADTRTMVRKAMELELIRSRRAELNVRR
jgi:hypothetical protein